MQIYFFLLFFGVSVYYKSYQQCTVVTVLRPPILIVIIISHTFKSDPNLDHFPTLFITWFCKRANIFKANTGEKSGLKFSDVCTLINMCNSRRVKCIESNRQTILHYWDQGIRNSDRVHALTKI